MYTIGVYDEHCLRLAVLVNKLSLIHIPVHKNSE